jgi:hypothetical protein
MEFNDLMLGLMGEAPVKENDALELAVINMMISTAKLKAATEKLKAVLDENEKTA